MYETLLRLYTEGRLKETGLAKAVTLTWISEEQKTTIIASVTTQ